MLCRRLLVIILVDCGFESSGDAMEIDVDVVENNAPDAYLDVERYGRPRCFR